MQDLYEGESGIARLRLPAPIFVLAMASLRRQPRDCHLLRDARPSIRPGGPQRKKRNQSRFERWWLG